MSAIRIIRLESKELPRQQAWLQALRSFDSGNAAVLKREGLSDVLRAELLGLRVVIKRRTRSGLSDRIKWVCGQSRHHRHWRGAEWLLAHGFGAARPLVLAVVGKQEWLVMEEVEGKSLLQVIADGGLSVRDEHQLARDVGRHLSALGKAGHFNRDHKPSNLIVERRRLGEKLSWKPKQPGRDGFSISIIDSVAIRRGKEPVRMLHALAVEPLGLRTLPRRSILARVLLSMFEADYELPGLDADEMRQITKGVRREMWDRVAESLRLHGDPTPRTNPLAPTPRPPFTNHGGTPR